ncbi:MAG: PP2C family protein-serine/threonine phosphatase, partial [Cyclonatronaceae bacterium]
PALLGLALFLLLMPWSHPPAQLTDLAEEGHLTSESRKFLDRSGFATDELEPFVVFKSNDELIYRQVAFFGKNQLKDHIQNGFLRFIPSYYWQVNWIATDIHEDMSLSMESYKQPFGAVIFRTYHSVDGAIQQFNLDDRHHERFRMPVPEAEERIAERSLPDPDAIRKGPLQSGDPEHQLIREWVRGTVWDNYMMTIDSTYQTGENGIERLHVVLIPQNGIFGHTPKVTLQMQTDGQLYSIGQDVIIPDEAEMDPETPEDFIRVIFFIIIVLIFLTLFIRRIFHRLVDLRSATIYGTMGAILLLLHLIQLFLQSSGYAHFDQQLLQIVTLTLITAVVCVFFGIFVFILTGLGESLTREVWPGKLLTISLLRFGYLKSSRIGNALAAGTLAAFLYLGLAAVLYTFADSSYLNLLDEQIFLAQSYLFPFWHIGINALVWAFLVTTVIFASLLPWAAINKAGRPLLALLGGLAFTLLSSFDLSTPGSLAIFLIWLIPGLAAVWIYLKHDLLTMLVSLFVFMALWTTTDARLVTGSPDAFLGWTVMVFSGLLLAGGILLALYGEKRDHMPELTPAYIREIAREQRVERELEIAHQVHQSFLPVNLPELEGMEAAASCQAAFDVGGDYYDVVKVDTHRVAFIIGDVSGKGIQAAFFMTMVKGIFQSLVKEIPEPVPLLTRMNRLFYDNARRGSFISLCYGLLDVRDGSLTYARAGHNPAILYRAADKKSEILRSGGLAIGLTREKKFEDSLTEVKLKLDLGDAVIFYTDGATERVDPEGRMFGEDRLLALTEKAESLHAQMLVDHITSSVDRFAASTPRNDDMTLLVVRRTNSYPGS